MAVIPDTYDEIIQEIKNKHNVTAKEYIPRACYALQLENDKLSKREIRDIIKKDLIEIWSPPTIYEHLPDEFKDKKKQEAGKQSHKNDIEKSAKESEQNITNNNEPITVSATTTGETVTDDNESWYDPNDTILTKEEQRANYEAQKSDQPQNNVTIPVPEPRPVDIGSKEIEDLKKSLKMSDQQYMKERELRQKAEARVLRLEQEPKQNKPILDPELAINDGFVFDDTLTANTMQADWIATELRKYLAEGGKIKYFLIQQKGNKFRVNVAREGFKDSR